MGLGWAVYEEIETFNNMLRAVVLGKLVSELDSSRISMLSGNDIMS